MPFGDDFFNDSFGDIVREFFDSSPVRRSKRREQFIEGEDEERNIDFIEDEKKVYIVFELPGYNEKDISIMIKGGELEIVAKKTKVEHIQDYLHQKLRQGISIQKKFPNFINPKNFSHTMKNGVLEIIFNKRK